ncbi:RNA polymerase sigma-70 factor [Streptomyces sp. NPDC058739]|uniref:RNA polymerase sigma-70 factor n=1 Tax=Streptomyces sp. NPDC058739 TaxID=3346618 RepID=UPI0036CA79E4
MDDEPRPAESASRPGARATARPADPATDPATDPFIEHRRLLFGTAYQMLGTVTDAEDVLQDTWLKWHAVDRDTVRHPKAYLVRTVTNLSLNRLTSARATRETYVGPWLPEPLLTAPNAAQEAEMADTVSTAMLVVLETLSPAERAVFVLREVFGYSHAEIAGFIDRPEPTVRQIAHRARNHVQSRRPHGDSDAAVRERVTEKFLAAANGGDLNALMELLAPDVTLWNDGGGKVTAARRPLYGPDHVARWLLGAMAKPSSAGARTAPTTLNGELGLIVTLGDTPIGALTYDIVDGHIQRLRFQVNPDKLAGLQRAAGEEPA